MAKVYTKGEAYDFALYHEEGVVFDVSDDCCDILIFFENPTEKEKANIFSHSKLELSYVRFSDVLMMLIKFGDLNWMDAPYTPHLSKYMSKIQIPTEGNGYSTNVFLFNTKTGVLENIRYFTMSNEFSCSLAGEMLDMSVQPFDHYKYNIHLNEIFNRYSTNNLVKMAPKKFKIF